MTAGTTLQRALAHGALEVTPDVRAGESYAGQQATLDADMARVNPQSREEPGCMEPPSAVQAAKREPEAGL